MFAKHAAKTSNPASSNVIANGACGATKQSPYNEEIASSGKVRPPRNDRFAETKKATIIEKQYCVYIMANAHHTVLYTGVTNNLQRRVLEHQSGKGSKFTSKYNVTKLVYFECGSDVNTAIFREKQIKAGSRKKKIDLIHSMNPEWKDLYKEHFG